jgi:uncharacterized protein Yka (UPF0111/DUF47 family)
MWRRGVERTVADLLGEQVAVAGRSVEAVRGLVDELPEPAEETVAALAKLEEEGDQLARELIGRAAVLRRPGPTLAGGEAQLLAQALDDITDAVVEFGIRLAAYRVEAPLEQALAYLDLLAEAVAALGEAVRQVRRGRAPEEAVSTVEDREHAGDRLEREALSSLYAEGIDPLLALRWTDLLGHLEQALDRCRRAGVLLSGLGGAR